MKKTTLLFALITCALPSMIQAMNEEPGNHESCLEWDLLTCRGKLPEKALIDMPRKSITFYFTGWHRARLTRTVVEGLRREFPDSRKISLIYPNGCEKIILNNVDIVLTKRP
jgi:hypothetical protein